MYICNCIPDLYQIFFVDLRRNMFKFLADSNNKAEAEAVPADKPGTASRVSENSILSIIYTAPSV